MSENSPKLPALVRFLPDFIKRRILNRPNLVKILDNIGWLFFDKILRMGVGLIVGVWVARYLGPEQFGMFNFATAFVGMFGAIAGLGLHGVVVRDLVREPSSKEEILGSAAALQLVGGFVAYGLILATIFWLRPDDALAKTIVAILGSMMLLKASEVAVCWFESQVLSKFTVWVQNGTFLVFASIKVLLILKGAPLVAFAWATMAEGVAVALMMLIVLGVRGPRARHLRVTVARSKSLLVDSWPLLLSGVAMMVYMKIDQIMLGQMVGDEGVGIYSAAVRISEVWYFIPGAVMATLFPTLAKLHFEGSTELSLRWVQAYKWMFWLSFFVAANISVFANTVVNTLFGTDYSMAAPVLIVHVWAGVNVAVGSVWSKWLLLENRLEIGFFGHLLGGIINVLFNIVLIPYYGTLGAAWATLLSYWISALIVYSLYKPLETFKYILRAITFKGSR
jgi:PST family polysaccharide transporter